MVCIMDIVVVWFLDALDSWFSHLLSFLCYFTLINLDRFNELDGVRRDTIIKIIILKVWTKMFFEGIRLFCL